ncbi:MAG TPA: carboxypeptidase regulatory-like domain-containing protein [Candidatus Sulfotelmatobacter sp.]|nr:carboxypeptidase regulatory-like domain-containing protein [Candidatus Sulfotelmatobacter sp.]
MRARIILVLVLLAAVSLSAQTFRGTILGTVTDASGAVVSGAKVTAKNVATGSERTTETSADGSYSLPELQIGTYTVTVTLTGFQTFITTGVTVDVAGERRIDAAMKTGQVSTKVEVSGDLLPQVETTSAELGGTLTAQTIESLPVNGRDYQKLIYLNPGIAGSPDQITDSPGSYGVFSMNGSRGRSNNFLLDGTDMNDGFRNDPAINEAGVFGDPATILPLDAVAELKVISNYEAEYGRNSGAVINIVTKSGTNQLHGSLLEYFRTGKLGARNYFNFDPNPKGPFNNNQFGGSLGGPIVKDKTFFYLDYEGQRENGAQAGTTCVPSPTVIAATEASIKAGGGTVDPVITALLARNPYPVPNIAGAYSDVNGCTNPVTGTLTNNVSTSTSFYNRVDSAIAKIDHNFNSNNMVAGRYYIGDSSQAFPFAQLAGGLLPGFDTVTPTRVQLISLSYVKVVNADQVNEARLGWNRFAEGFFAQDQNFIPNSIGMDTGVTSTYNGGLPSTNVGSFSQIGSTDSLAKNRVDANWHFVDNYSWKSGKHDVKFGYEFRRTTIAQVFDHDFRGTLDFSSLTTFLEGIPDNGGSQIQGDTERHTYQNSHGLFVQDSFRATPRLTLNYGMRWDYFGVVGGKSGQFYTVDFSNGGNNVPTGQLYGKDLNNFAPRVAAAYDVTGKGQTVVRAGWGLFYDAFAQDMFLGHLPWNCIFCPGPAYPGLGPNALGEGSAAANVITPGVPIYSGFAPEGNFFFADPKLRTPYVQNFNLNFQQQIGSKTVLQLGYVGSVGIKLFQFLDINQPSQAQITAADLGCDCINSYGVPRTAAPNFFYLNEERSSANSNYHSLQASLRTSGWHGLTSQANFVWSHAIDDASDSEDFEPNESQPTNSTNPAGDRGNSSFDIRRRFTWNFVYQFPKTGGSMQRLKNGWGLDGILNLQDGQPWHLNYEFEGEYSGSGEGFDRPDEIATPQYNSSNPAQYINLSAFAAPCTFGNPNNDGSADETNCIPGTRHFGSEGRNSLHGPSFKEFNFSVFKDTSLAEHVTMSLRAEFFNLLNHPNFVNPFLPNFIADIGAPNAGNGYAPGSYYPITATGDVGIGNPFLGGGGPRGVQFAAILKF